MDEEVWNIMCMRFRDLLAKVDGELDKEDLEYLVFLCDSNLDNKTQQSITTAHHLFDVLERKRLISPCDLTLLNILFKIIGRMDLFAMLPENSNFNYESDGEDRFISRRYENYVNPFNYLLFHINEEMDQEEVERMRYNYGVVPRNVKISSALDLFKIMRKNQAIKPDNLERLKAMLERIGRSDLLELVDNFSRDNFSSASAVVSQTPVPQPDLSANNVQSVSWPVNPVISGSDSDNNLSDSHAQTHPPTFWAISSPDVEVNQISRMPPSRTQHPARSMSAPSGTPYKPPTNASCLSHHSIQENIPISERSAKISEEVAQNSSIGESDKYRMNSDPRGICLVYNFDQFNHPSLLPRQGSDKDAESLNNCFEILKFEVHNFKNLTLPEMKETLEDYRNRDHTSYDCFACCVLSHGKEGSIFCSDGSTMKISELISYFNAGQCPSLCGKPKLFFLSCCQGTDKPLPHPVPGSYESDGPHDTSKSVSETADFVIGYSTLFGYASLRHPTEGTLYIQTLCDNLLKYHKSHHLLDILQKINKELSERPVMCEVSEGMNCIQIQVSAPQFTLVKQVWL